MTTEIEPTTKPNGIGRNPAREFVRPAITEELAVLNWPEALRRVDGDDQLLGEMAGLFLGTYPDQFAKIAEAIENSDAGSLEIHAHTLKGTARVFCAEGVVTAAANLEQMAEQKSWPPTLDALERLRQELSRMRPALQKKTLPAAAK
ncbi:MAG: Hpt domain-containing protein [Verrucomicrobia bacterium]|nr:Hpt domain-containing protein [Verrucomicrobiota bacterium]